MSEMRACKECGKMFMPKGREKYCSDVHYRPCPVCGTPLVAKYLSDPPCKCKNCRGKKIQTKGQVKSLFKIDTPNIPVIHSISIEKALKMDRSAKNKDNSESKNNTSKSLVDKKSSNVGKVQSIDVTKLLDSDKFCETYDDKIMRYMGPNFGQFENNHDYKIVLTRKDNYYLITSCHDITESKEVNCFYLASSQLNISNRFAVVDQ